MLTWQYAVSPARVAVVVILVVLATMWAHPAHAKNRIPNIPWEHIPCEEIPGMAQKLNDAAEIYEDVAEDLDEAGLENLANDYYKAADEARAEAKDGMRHWERGDCVG